MKNIHEDNQSIIVLKAIYHERLYQKAVKSEQDKSLARCG